MWEWLQGLSGGAANFVGAVAGSAVGLVALLIGALFNAHLNRLRDDRLRREETRAVAAALLAELKGAARVLNEAFSETHYSNAKGERASVFWVPDFGASIRLMPVMLPKLGALPVETIGLVVDAYLAIEKHHALLYLKARKEAGEEPRKDGSDIRFPLSEKPMVQIMHELLVGKLEDAIESLEPYAR
jgi:hypothetical protein